MAQKTFKLTRFVERARPAAGPRINGDHCESTLNIRTGSSLREKATRTESSALLEDISSGKRPELYAIQQEAFETLLRDIGWVDKVPRTTNTGVDEERRA